jgi:anti-sigma B factor antagonist
MSAHVIEDGAGVYIVTLKGDVDMSTSPQVRDALVPLWRKDVQRIVVDLAQVPYMDSSGIATLIEALKSSQKHGFRLVLAGLTPAVEAAFELAHLRDIFEIVSSVEPMMSGEIEA